MQILIIKLIFFFLSYNFFCLIIFFHAFDVNPAAVYFHSTLFYVQMYPDP